ncbi:MAG: FCD domain-containing protein [Desulfobacteraceae bacterium]|nr:FCD domain-containing protein [Desulfobacteraceae bacterium]
MNRKTAGLPEQKRDKVHQLPVTEDLFLHLRKDIINGRYTPGSKLRLDELRGVYGVGSSPLREVLSHLAAIGLVRKEIQRGFSVAPASTEDLRDIGENRIRFETIALRLAIENGDDDWECKILGAEHLLSKKKYSPAKPDTDTNREWEHHHRSFHMALIEASASYWLLHFCGLLYDQFDRYRRMVADQGLKRDKLDREHHDMMRLTLDRNTDQACTMLVDHIHCSMDMVLTGFKAIAQ